MTIEHNYEDDAVSLLLPQFNSSPRLRELIKALISPAQETLDGVNQISVAYDVRTAEGAQLDLLGKLLNVSRLGRDDDELRSAIQGRILVNRANGTASNVIELLNLALPDIEYTVIEQFPASYQVLIYSPQNVINEELIQDISPIGVRAIFFGNPYQNKTIFQVSDVDSGGTITGGTPMVNVADLPTTDQVLINVIYQ